jgi:hypothetical protein
MKKVKFLSLALIITSMFMGVGYAAWGKELKITNNVQAGNLRISSDGTINIKVYPDVDCNTEDPLTRNFNTSTDTNFSTGTITIPNLYPGAKAVVTIPFRNDSTIPVKLQDVNIVPKIGTSIEHFGITTVVPTGIISNLAGSNTDTIKLTVIAGDNTLENETIEFNYSPRFLQFNK